jgi:hypothetical protein
MATRSSHRHGTLPPEFAAWIAIRSRDPANEVWCSFVDFYFDVGPRPSWRHLLIRDDPAGDFSPGNARCGLQRGIDGRDRPLGHVEHFCDLLIGEALARDIKVDVIATPDFRSEHIPFRPLGPFFGVKDGSPI